MGGRARVVVVPLLIAAAVAIALVLGRLEKLELISIDLRYPLLARGEPAPLALVTIDQNSIKDVGVWPWPRRTYVPFFEALARDGARCLLVDLDFSSPGADPEADRALVRAVRSVPTFLAMHMEEKEGEGGFVLRNLSIPFPELDAAAAGVGSIVFDVDADGTVRRLPPTVEFGDRDFPPLGVLGARALDPELVYEPPSGAMFRISSSNLEDIPTFSFAEVAEGLAPEGTFSGRVVLLGATSLDLRDFWNSPLGVIPGVYLHAAVLETALDHSYLVRPDRRLVLALVLACSLALGLVMGRTGWKGGALALLSYVAFVVAAAAFSLRWQVMLEVVPLLLVGLAQFPVHVMLHARRTEEVLDLEKRRTDAILKMSELEDAEETGQQPYVVPLVLLRQVLGLDTVRLFLLEGELRDAWREDAVIGDAQRPYDEKVLSDALRGGEVIRVRGGEGAGASVYVPIKTVRKPVGALFVAGPAAFAGSDSDLRLLLSYATQTAYFLESKELAEKMKEEEAVRTNLARYLSPQIVEQIIQHKVQVNLGGDRKVVTVLFSDIRNFTTISETLAPDVLVSILNDYFNEMASIIFQHQGSLDKYIGDAIVAVFGSLIEVENPAVNAAQAAVDMMKFLPRLNRRWAERYDGFSMAIGIGISTGEVFLGNIGSMERMEFTVIGDTVNVASRFSGLAKPGQILLTEEARRMTGDALRLQELPPAMVKGKSEALAVFEVIY